MAANRIDVRLASSSHHNEMLPVVGPGDVLLRFVDLFDIHIDVVYEDEREACN
jgi:hypothetical protein